MTDAEITAALSEILSHGRRDLRKYLIADEHDRKGLLLRLYREGSSGDGGVDRGARRGCGRAPPINEDPRGDRGSDSVTEATCVLPAFPDLLQDRSAPAFA